MGGNVVGDVVVGTVLVFPVVIILVGVEDMLVATMVEVVVDMGLLSFFARLILNELTAASWSSSYGTRRSPKL